MPRQWFPRGIVGMGIKGCLYLLPLLAVGACNHSPVASSTANSCRRAQLSGIQFVSAMVAWANGSCGSRGPMLRTTDGGRTWSLASPTSRAYPVGANSTAFAGPRHAWLAWPIHGGQDIVACTRDGGRTWRRTVVRVISPYGTPDFATLTFLNAQDGWIATRYAGMHASILQLLRTTNGGASWHSLATRPPISVILGFQTTSLGYGVDVQAGGSVPTIYRTTDGGHVWRPRSLPVPGIYRRVRITLNFGAIRTRGTRDVALAAIIQPLDLGSHASLVIYRSHDGGAHWTGSAPLNLGSSSNGVSTALAGLSVAWAITDRGLYATHDAGRIWVHVATNVRLSPADQLDLVTPHLGFALVNLKRGQKLLRSHDGHTWRLAASLR
jgi:photosystem II stability/assembly factor-like uncharacterized protein